MSASSVLTGVLRIQESVHQMAAPSRRHTVKIRAVLIREEAGDDVPAAKSGKQGASPAIINPQKVKTIGITGENELSGKAYAAQNVSAVTAVKNILRAYFCMNNALI